MYSPKPLTAAERAAFFFDVGSPYDWDMPPWGIVVQWKQRLILVFLGVETDVVSGRLVFLTDVTMFQNDILRYPKTFESNAFVYHIPAEFLNRVKEVVPAAKDVLIAVAQTVGETAGSVIKPIVEPMSWILIAVGIFGVVYAIGRRP